VSGVIDVTGRANLAGAGLNMAQRVMACGDGALCWRFWTGATPFANERI